MYGNKNHDDATKKIHFSFFSFQDIQYHFSAKLLPSNWIKLPDSDINAFEVSKKFIRAISKSKKDGMVVCAVTFKFGETLSSSLSPISATNEQKDDQAKIH